MLIGILEPMQDENQQESYIYPFRKNAKGTNTSNLYAEKADAIERHIFDSVVLPHVEQLGDKKLVVDIGAGEGRYSQYFGKDADRVIALEPDEHRCNKTRENTQSMTAEVQCWQTTVKDADVADQSADVVVNIHVLQHIHPDDANAILDFAARTVRSGGLFVFAFTKKTKKDEDWNITWEEEGRSHYVEVPEEVFRMISGAHLPTVLPVRKLHTDEVIQEVEKRGFSILSTTEYAPRFLGEKKKLKGKFFMWLYRTMSAASFHALVSRFGYPLLEDIVVVARKQ